MTRFFTTTYQGILSFGDKFNRDNTFSMAAALAFYAALSIAPLLILFITLAAQVSNSLQDVFVREVTSLIGERAGDAITMIVNAAKDRPDLKSSSGLFGFLTLAISASAVFGELKNSLNRILKDDSRAKETKKKSNFIWDFLLGRILNIGFVLSFLFILLVSLILSSVINVYAPMTDQFWTQIVNWIFSFAVQMVLFSLLYRYVPDQGQPWTHAFISGAITALLFSIGKEIVSLYIGHSAVASAYGAAGSVIVLLIWIFYSAMIVFSGAQISFLIMKRKDPLVQT